MFIFLLYPLNQIWDGTFHVLANKKSMKKIGYVVISVMLVTLSYSCSSGHYVSERPQEVIVNRPGPPGTGYMWVDGDYNWRGGRYVYQPGYWARPHGSRTWRTGSWVQGPHGYYWRRGGWR